MCIPRAHSVCTGLGLRLGLFSIRKLGFAHSSPYVCTDVYSIAVCGGKYNHFNKFGVIFVAVKCGGLLLQ